MLGLWAFLAIGAVSLFAIFLPVTSWIEARRKEREAFYQSETLRRIAESSSDGAKAAIGLLEQQNYNELVKKREGMKIGGLVNIGVGIALIIFLGLLTQNHNEMSFVGNVGLVGLIPLLIGVALLIYVYFMAPPLEPPNKK